MVTTSRVIQGYLVLYLDYLSYLESYTCISRVRVRVRVTRGLREGYAACNSVTLAIEVAASMLCQTQNFSISEVSKMSAGKLVPVRKGTA
jgi:hypothetical protein